MNRFALLFSKKTQKEMSSPGTCLDNDSGLRQLWMVAFEHFMTGWPGYQSAIAGGIIAGGRS
jgi:hypothetical protein